MLSGSIVSRNYQGTTANASGPVKCCRVAKAVGISPIDGVRLENMKNGGCDHIIK